VNKGRQHIDRNTGMSCLLHEQPAERASGDNNQKRFPTENKGQCQPFVEKPGRAIAAVEYQFKAQA